LPLGVVSIRIFNVVVKSAAFFPVGSAFDDQFCDSCNIPEFYQTGFNLKIPVIFLDLVLILLICFRIEKPGNSRPRLLQETVDLISSFG